MVSWLFGGQNECFLVVVFDQLAVALGNDLFVHRVLVFSEERGLDEHGCDKVERLECLEVDLHVMRDLSTLLFNFKLLGLVLLPTVALTKQLLEPEVLVGLYEDLVCLLDVAVAEGSHTSLCKSSVVQDLVVGDLNSDDLRHVSLLEEIASLIKSVMKTVVVCLVKGCSDSHLGGAMVVDLLHELSNFFL